MKALALCIAGLSRRALFGLTIILLIAACGDGATVHSVDAIGNESISSDQTFDTVTSTSSANAAIIADLENRVGAIYSVDWVEGISPDAGVDMYYRWPGIDGLVDLYQATGKSTHIDRAVAMALRYISLGQDLNDDGYLDWFSRLINDHSHAHVEVRAADGIARITEILHTDNALTARYETEAQVFLGYLEKDVWEKAEVGAFNVQNMLETNVTHFIGRSGLIAVSLYKITGKKKYLNWIESKGANLKNALVLGANGAYTFNCYLDGSSCTGGAIIDTSHAGDTINFIVEAHRAGLVFDAVDIERLIETVRKHLWNGSLSSPKFNDLVDGSGIFGRMGRNQGGWVKLAVFDDELRSLYHAWIQSPDLVPLSPTFSVTRGTRVHILGNLAKAYSE